MAKISQTISQLQTVQNEIPHKFLRNVVFDTKTVFVSKIGLLSPTRPLGVTVQLQKRLDNNFLFGNFQVCTVQWPLLRKCDRCVCFRPTGVWSEVQQPAGPSGNPPPPPLPIPPRPRHSSTGPGGSRQGRGLCRRNWVWGFSGRRMLRLYFNINILKI